MQANNQTEAKVSVYPNIWITEGGSDISLLSVLKDIQAGRWQDGVFAVRREKTDEAIKKAKESLPYFTVSGTFQKRSNSGLSKHSGFICMDFDDIDDVNYYKSVLGADPYTYSMFTSASGKGIAVIVKIPAKLHTEAFIWLSGYYLAHYDFRVDEHCKDVSRPRYVSYDPDLYINYNSIDVKVEPRKVEAPKKFVFVEDDFENVLKQIVERRLDLTSTYMDWREMGFAIADRFGESGLEYFHQVSQFHPNYNPAKTEKQFRSFCKGTGTKTITISTFFHKAKLAGCRIYSPKTENIIRTAAIAKKDRTRSMDSIVPALVEVGRIEEHEADTAQKIVEQVYKEDIQPEEQSIVLDIKEFVESNYKMRRNEVTRNIELDGKPLDDIGLNSIFIAVKTAIDKTSKDLLSAIIFSEFTPSYNPFEEFFINNTKLNEKAAVGRYTDEFLNCIVSDTHNYQLFTKKWLVSMVASIHGEHSPLMLVLAGGQNTGKTEWFRRLLPTSLRMYYAESMLDGKKEDDYNLMTKKLIIMDDEFGGKSKKEEKTLKSTLSKQTFSIREPYGRIHVDLHRLCMLAGTTNEEQIINDPTGNRRIIPVNVISIDHNLYNNIDKDMLFMDLYRIYLSGWNYRLTKEEIKSLNASTEQFEEISVEEELFKTLYRPASFDDQYVELLQNAEILSNIQAITKTSLNAKRLGQILKKLGLSNKVVRSGAMTKRVYPVVKVYSGITDVTGSYR